MLVRIDHLTKNCLKFFQKRSYFFSNRKKMRIERDGSDTVTIHPDEGHHSATVVLMHGLGDSADGWQSMAEQWASVFPYIKFILPTAPRRPVTLNGGMPMPAWYDIVGLTDRASESCEGIEESVATIRDFIEKEISLGLPSTRVALAGFSQGGAMSLFCGLQLPSERRLAGVLVMSGYLPGASKFNLTAGFEDLKVLHCHGTSDPVVQFKWAEMTRDAIQEKGSTAYELKSYSGMMHEVRPETIKYATEFVKTILPFDASLALKPKPPSEMSVKELKMAIRNAGLGSKAVGFSEKHEFVTLLEEYYASK